MMCRSSAESRKQLRGLRVLPPALRGKPARRGEVIEREHRCDPMLMAGGQHPPVMLQFRRQKFTGRRFDPRPFQGKSVGIEAETRQQRDVLAVELVVIAGIARTLGKDRRLDMLQQPNVAVDVAALHLMTGGGGAPQKSFRIPELT